jgi:hypothetical protein
MAGPTWTPDGSTFGGLPWVRAESSGATFEAMTLDADEAVALARWLLSVFPAHAAPRREGK